jgi:hypothetical protein
MSDFPCHEPRCTGSRSLTPEQLDLAIALMQEQIAILDQLISISEVSQTELLQKRHRFESLEIDLQKLLRHRPTGRKS